ncbi:uncharacterized protein [Physcomitrium patens]|uniref:Uncharacterized protein n=1 Tax=Physcomitrium patens TaxID=3218 RepID=A0A7I4CKY9_PHYPA|nr:uncharacterized protein LOC112276999 isoform X1 [Physcomitrium patens]|eukprot:XP_024364674.1 uncharacterized protein LOC112276999 isoform X1 [Physcomitrella patens]
MMTTAGADPDRGLLIPRSELSDSSDIVGTPGVVPFVWEVEPGRPKGPGQYMFDSTLTREIERRESLLEGTSNWPREILEYADDPDTSASSLKSSGSSPDDHAMKLNLRASLMGVHILDDETEMFFSRQVSNASTHNFQAGGAVPFMWEVEPGRPAEAVTRDPSIRPLTPPPGSRPVSGILYPGQFGNKPSSGLLYHGQQSAKTGSRPSSTAHYSGQIDLGPDSQFGGGGMHFSEKLFKKLVRQSRAAPYTNSTSPYGGFGRSTSKKRGESSTEALDRHFGVYSPDMRYEDHDSVSPTSTLDHHESEASPSSQSERLYPSRNPKLTRYVDNSTPKARTSSQDTSSIPVGRPSSQLAQCLMSLTAMADDTTDDDDIIFEQPSTTAPLWQPVVQVSEPQVDWPIVQYQGPPTKPSHRHPKSSTTSPKSGRTIERWSSNSSSWNLSLVSKPKATVTKVVISGGKKSRSKRHSSGVTNGVTLREIHTGASLSTVLTYDRSKDAHGRHKWEKDSPSCSLPSSDELGFEAYDRPGEQMVHQMDEEDFPFSPIASSFVFGEHNSSVEFSQRGGRNGIPRAVGPIVREFSSSNFELHELHECMSVASGDSHTYSLESGFLQPEQDWIPTKSFHYIKSSNLEIVEVGSSRLNGYIEINHSGRFSIDLHTGPRLERHLSSGFDIEKTPDVLLRIVEEAHSLSQRKRAKDKYGCFFHCTCLPVRKKGFLGRCLTSNQAPGLAVGNNFESRLRSRSLGSLNTKNHTGPFQF